MHRFGLGCVATDRNGVGAAVRLVRKPSVLTFYGWIEGLFRPRDKKSPHGPREDARRAAGHVAWSPAGQRAGFLMAGIFRMPAGLTIKDER